MKTVYKDKELYLYDQKEEKKKLLEIINKILGEKK